MVMQYIIIIYIIMIEILFMTNYLILTENL